MSLMIVLRHLSNEFGNESHKDAGKPRMTTAMTFKRLYFAKIYEDWTAEQWDKVYSSINRWYNSLWCVLDM